jgi:predicted nucleotidyltransferase
MRLANNEIEAIKSSFTSVFGTGHIYLFGSRIDDTQKGGDIDLYIDTDYNDNIQTKKIEFLVELKSKIGEQKIDVVISKDKSRAIEQEALSKGIRLC